MSNGARKSHRLKMSFGKLRFFTLLAALSGFCLGLATPNMLAAQSIGPSFDCRQANAQDEQAICRDPRLAELDQTVSAAFNQVGQSNKQQAKDTARELLAARHACATDRLCILDQQVNAIEIFAAFGAPVAVPSWVGAYRAALFAARHEAPASGMPVRIGQCSLTRIASIGSRFDEELKPPSAGHGQRHIRYLHQPRRTGFICLRRSGREITGRRRSAGVSRFSSERLPAGRRSRQGVFGHEPANERLLAPARLAAHVRRRVSDRSVGWRSAVLVAETVHQRLVLPAVDFGNTRRTPTAAVHDPRTRHGTAATLLHSNRRCAI